MLLGWGAPPLTLASANEFVRNLAARDRLMRPGGDGTSAAGIVLDDSSSEITLD